MSLSWPFFLLRSDGPCEHLGLTGCNVQQLAVLGVAPFSILSIINQQHFLPVLINSDEGFV
ncbi:hypothetical protein D3C81_2005750 [compost metagenome]